MNVLFENVWVCVRACDAISRSVWAYQSTILENSMSHHYVILENSMSHHYVILENSMTSLWKIPRLILCECAMQFMHT